jgi:hypothetical protein
MLHDGKGIKTNNDMDWINKGEFDKWVMQHA